MKKIIILICAIIAISCVQAQEVCYMTQDEFRERVFDYKTEKQWKYKGEKPCIIDFYTTWCGPCKMLAPTMEKLAAEYPDVDFYKIDTEKERELAGFFGIRSIPTLFFIPMEGKIQVAQGALPKETLEQAIQEIFGVKK